MIALLIAGALAGDPAPVREGTDNGNVIIVYGDLLVEQARQELISQLRDEGYTELIDKGDHLILRNQAAWKGDVLIYDDGWVQMKRQPLQVDSPELPYAHQGSALAWAHCVIFPTICVKPGGWTLTRRRWLGVEDGTMGSIASDAQIYGDRVADRSVDQRANGLPAKLEALWNDGTPLVGDGPALATPAERKGALLDYWESRTDTVWGDRVRASIDAFVRAEVQTSDAPFTADEIAAFNARRHCNIAYDMTRDWDAFLAAEPTSPQ